VYLFLVVAPLVVYWPVATFDFINYDDPAYVFSNPIVTGGITFHGVKWAALTSYYDFWHPLTWYSHMMDCELFGLTAGAHHLINLGFHIANTVLLFGILSRMTGTVARSAVVAALFALHPLHVESVAWVAERKDVLSTFFLLLAIRSYGRYVESKNSSFPFSNRSYWLALLFFALGLMAKAMIVTLPFVLLLLDYWPLKRFPGERMEESAGDNFRSGLIKLVREKIPFFCLSLASSLITYLGMKLGQNVLSGEAVPWSLRIENAVVSYLRYLGKIIWPDSLTVLYPLPRMIPVWHAIGALLMVSLISLLAIKLCKSRPYFFVGWCLFLGTLVPVIGLVAMGSHSIADRYTYVPAIGIFVLLVWGLVEFWSRQNLPLTLLKAAGAIAILVCATLTWRQVHYWRNSFTLWSHCIAINNENAIAHYNLGHYFQHSEQTEKAIEQYIETLRIDPRHLDANLNLGVAYAALGRFDQATNYITQALQIKADYAIAHVNMGYDLWQLKDYLGASNHYARAVALNPLDADSHCALAYVLLEVGDTTNALDHIAEALRLNPSDQRALVARDRALTAKK
jgi:hypothetical protein